MRSTKPWNRTISSRSSAFRRDLAGAGDSGRRRGIADCCRFRLVGHTPYLTRGEALVAAKAWRAAGRKDVVVPADGSCPFLHPNSGKCRIYDGRPFGCRTHFCAAAGGPAARNEVRDLIQRLEDIDRRLGGNGAMNLPVAVKAAMNSGR